MTTNSPQQQYNPPPLFIFGAQNPTSTNPVLWSVPPLFNNPFSTTNSFILPNPFSVPNTGFPPFGFQPVPQTQHTGFPPFGFPPVPQTQPIVNTTTPPMLGQQTLLTPQTIKKRKISKNKTLIIVPSPQTPPKKKRKITVKKSQKDITDSWKKQNFQLTERKKMIAAIKELVMQDNTHQPGSFVGSTKVERGRHKFNGQRDIQILRELASQIFFWLQKENQSPIEVQAGYLAGSIFIATNSNASLGHLKTHLDGSPAAKLKEIMLEAYTPRLKVSKEKSSRLKKKLTNVYNDTRFDFSQVTTTTTNTQPQPEDVRRMFSVKKIVDLMKTCTTVKVVDSGSVETITAGVIYLVQDPNDNDHAELRIAKFIAACGTPVNEPVPIYGRKRPCFICHRRLAKIKTLHNYFEFSEMSGFLFKNQLDELSSQELYDLYATLVDHMEGHTRIVHHKSKFGGAEEDSGSESEGDSIGVK